MDWPTVQRGIDDVLRSDKGPADKAVQIAELVRQAGGYRWVGLTGTVTAIRDRPTAQADIAEMARRYHADDPAKADRLITQRFERQERISFRVRIDAVHDHLDD